MPGGFEFGGIGRMMMYAAASLPQHGVAPRTLDGRGRGRLVFSLWHQPMTVLELLSLRRRGSLDVLHLNVAGRASTLRKIVLSEVAGRLRLPTVVHLHDYDYAQDYRKRGALGRHLVRRMFQRAHRVLVLGRRDRKTAIELLGATPGKVSILHNAVPDGGPAAPRDVPAGREPHILFLGHLSERKGVPELLHALASPELVALPWRATLAGGGDGGRFAGLAHELGLADRVAFPGWVPHEATYALLREADVFTLPSHNEGLAVSLLEAMAHGLPIVATAVGAHDEVVEHGRDALLVAPGDPRALAAALSRLLGDAPGRAALGAAARRRYLEGFNAQDYGRRLASVHYAAAGR